MLAFTSSASVFLSTFGDREWGYFWMTAVLNRPIIAKPLKKSSNQKGDSAKEHLAVLIYILNVTHS